MNFAGSTFHFRFFKASRRILRPDKTKGGAALENTEMIFQRTEKKYAASEKNAGKLLELIAPHIREDEHGVSEVCSLYFDTPDCRVIRESAEQPQYKEKLRLRSYGVPGQDSEVYLEMKKKLSGVVYKRREAMTLAAANAYIERGVLPSDSQIMREIDWMRRIRGGLMPRVYIACQRTAFYAADDPDVRVTFDRNILFRTDDLHLESGVSGTPLGGGVLVEVKGGDAIPLWLAAALDSAALFPAPFSKYGEVYKKTMMKNGGTPCSVKSFSPSLRTASRSAITSCAH